jgi:hypothetical protein
MTTELIARLEAATKGSEELDEKIALMLYPEIVCSERENSWRLHGIHVRIEAYSRSVDTALSLVPEGWHVKLERFSDGWYATLWAISGRPITCKGEQKPAALALCIAALRARTEKP